MRKEPEIIELIKEVECAAGHKVSTPTDFNNLSDCIFEKTKETLSPTTLKRIWGYIDGYESVRYNTLSVLARYIDYKDWDDFCIKLQASRLEESNEIYGTCIRSSELVIGDKIAVSWLPNRKCVFEYIGDNLFEVAESHNSKLNTKDTFHCTLFMIGQPLYLDNLKSNDNQARMYVAGKKSGIISIEKI